MATHQSTSHIYTRPVEILQKLIQFNTTNPPGNEAECIAYIRGLLSDTGIESIILAKTPERPNLIAHIKGMGKAKPIMLYGHVDVVTTENQKWDHPPFEGKIVDGVVWGRGMLVQHKIQAGRSAFGCANDQKVGHTRMAQPLFTAHG